MASRAQVHGGGWKGVVGIEQLLSTQEVGASLFSGGGHSFGGDELAVVFWSLDGLRLAITSDHSGICESRVTSADGTALRPLTHQPGGNSGSSWTE